MPPGREGPSHRRRFHSIQGGVLPPYSRTESGLQDPPYICQKEAPGAAPVWRRPLSAYLEYRESHEYALGAVTFCKIGGDVVPFCRRIQRIANRSEGRISVRSREVDSHRRGIALMCLIPEDVHHRLQRIPRIDSNNNATFTRVQFYQTPHGIDTQTAYHFFDEAQIESLGSALLIQFLDSLSGQQGRTPFPSAQHRFIHIGNGHYLTQGRERCPTQALWMA